MPQVQQLMLPVAGAAWLSAGSRTLVCKCVLLHLAVNFEALIIAMSVVGGMILIMLLVCCCCCCKKKSKKQVSGWAVHSSPRVPKVQMWAAAHWVCVS